MFDQVKSQMQSSTFLPECEWSIFSRDAAYDTVLKRRCWIDKPIMATTYSKKLMTSSNYVCIDYIFFISICFIAMNWYLMKFKLKHNSSLCFYIHILWYIHHYVSILFDIYERHSKIKYAHYLKLKLITISYFKE